MQLGAFIKQKPDEEIVYILHRHPITFIPVIFLFVVLLVVPFAVHFLITSLFPTLFVGVFWDTIGVLIGSAYFLAILMFTYTQFTTFYLDLWIITTERLIDVEQKGLFSREIVELDLSHIQDITANVDGIFPTMFNYGEVLIKTASVNQEIIAHSIPYPNVVREHLVTLAEKERQEDLGGKPTL